MNQKAILLKDAKRKTINVLYSTPYERDTPNMSRARCLKRGESAVNTALNRIPVHLEETSHDPIHI